MAGLTAIFMFEDHSIRGLKKMRMLLTLSFIVMNGMAVAKIKNGQTKNLAAATKVSTVAA